MHFLCWAPSSIFMCILKITYLFSIDSLILKEVDQRWWWMGDSFESKGRKTPGFQNTTICMFIISLTLLTKSRGECLSGFIARESEAQKIKKFAQHSGSKPRTMAPLQSTSSSSHLPSWNLQCVIFRSSRYFVASNAFHSFVGLEIFSQ